MESHKKRWITPKEFEIEFSVSKSTQAKKRSNKILPYTKWGGSVLYDRLVINKMFELSNQSRKSQLVKVTPIDQANEDKIKSVYVFRW